jgi:Flp pilus assembly protein TadD
MNGKRTQWRETAVLVLAAVAAYGPALGAGFVFDDWILLVHHPLIQAADGLRRIWATTEAPDYYPVTWTSWWLQWRLWGNDPFGYHAVNVLLHAVNVVLLVRVLRAVFGAPTPVPSVGGERRTAPTPGPSVGGERRTAPTPGPSGEGERGMSDLAWWVGLVFAVHPVNVSAVAWVSSHKTVLCTSLFLASVLAWLRWQGIGTVTAKRQQAGALHISARWYMASLGLFALSLLAKPGAVMWPVVMLGLAWWKHRPVTLRDFIRCLPFLVLSAAIAPVTVWFQGVRVLAGESAEVGGLLTRLALAGQAVWFYVWKALAPVGLCAIYPKWPIDTGNPVVYLPGVAVVAVLAACAWRGWAAGRTRKGAPTIGDETGRGRTEARPSEGGGGLWRAVVAGFGYYVVMLFPVLGFFDQGFYRYTWVADHWQYLALPGLIALVVGAVQSSAFRVQGSGFTVVPKESRSRPEGRSHNVKVVVAGAVVVVLAVLTWKQATLYHDDERLWLDTIAKNPAAWLAHYNLGIVLAQQGKFDEAVASYEQALRYKPDDVETLDNLGAALNAQGRLAEAVARWRQAVRYRPTDAAAHNNLGIAYARQGDLDRARREFKLALMIEPNDFESRANLGSVYLSLGRYAEAAAQFQAALRINPNVMSLRLSLGVALTQLGWKDEAMAELRAVLQVEPSNSVARAALRQLGVAE